MHRVAIATIAAFLIGFFGTILMLLAVQQQPRVLMLQGTSTVIVPTIIAGTPAPERHMTLPNFTPSADPAPIFEKLGFVKQQNSPNEYLATYVGVVIDVLYDTDGRVSSASIKFGLDTIKAEGYTDTVNAALINLIRYVTPETTESELIAMFDQANKEERCIVRLHGYSFDFDTRSVSAISLNITKL